MRLRADHEFSDLLGRRTLTRAAILSVLSLAVLALLALGFGHEPEVAAFARQQNAIQPDPSFDYLVREDMFAGMAGDRPRLDRAIKLCEDRLTKNPKYPEALVWHGSGIYFLAGQAFRDGQFDKGMELQTRGLKEMDDAVALLPDSITVLIPRGATLLEGSKHTPFEAQARMLLEKALTDYDKVYAIQKKDLENAPVHSRGELLSALAKGWYRVGNMEKARAYLRMIVEQLKDSEYATRAKKVLDDSNPPKQLGWHCIGCHAAP